MEKGKNKKLSVNIILFAISSIGTKFLSFFLVPFYTNFLSTEEYGIIDLIVNTAALLLPIFTLCIYESVMRFTISDSSNPAYFRIGWVVSISGAAVLAVLMGILYFFIHDRFSVSGLAWIWLLFFCNAGYNIFTNYMRAVGRVSIMVEASILNSVILLSMNILLIAYLKIGMNGYFISTVAGLVISSMYMMIRLIPYKAGAYSVFKVDRALVKEMLQYCVPLIFTAVTWWVNSSLDRYFVTGFCGADANGIYSVAYKIPNILAAVQTVFTQAWAISAVTEFDKDDRDGFMGHTYEVFGMTMIFVCSGILLLNTPLSKLLYAKEFYSATYYVPYLLISTLFGALAGYFGGIFSAVKRSKICAASTVVSAVVNIILNTLLIPAFGITGAAVATMIAYFCSWLVRVIAAKRYVRLKANTKRMYVAFVLLFMQMICALGTEHFYIVQILIMCALALLFRKIIREIVGRILGKIVAVIKK